MDINLEKLRGIISQNYVAYATSIFGVKGADAVEELTSTITKLYRFKDPGVRKHPLVIFKKISSGNLFASSSNQITPIYIISDLQRINHELDDACTIEIAENNLNIFPLNTDEVMSLSNDSIVYIFDNKIEKIIIKGKVFTLVRLSSSLDSIFARPTFSSLREALENFRLNTVCNTGCHILAEAWSSENRIFFKVKPEWRMRRSLEQFLKNVFPNAEIRPEQNVDETHPVDIKVTWPDANQRAIIEIKWLGQSVNELGAITTKYLDSRARDGAKQLAEYLDSSHSSAPRFQTRGYLVVFDARRKGLVGGMTQIATANGLYYRDREIVYNPEFHKIRNDFDEPFRMFAEPKVI